MLKSLFPEIMKGARKWISYSLKIAVSIGACVYVYFKITQNHLFQDGKVSLAEVFFSVEQGNWPIISIAILLVGLNLGLEARKWQLLMREFYPEIKFSTSVKAILTGMTTGIFTPNRLGEYAGRVLYLDEGHRLEATLLTFLDRISQMFITLLTGIIALLVMVSQHGTIIEEYLGGPGASQLLVLALGAFLFFIIGIIFNPRLVLYFFRKIDLKANWARKVESTLMRVKPNLLRKILILAMARYFVFSSQYVLFLYGFSYEEGILLAYGIVAMVFLLKSLVPFVGLSELGVRESAAITIMGLFAVAPWIAMKSSLALYLINIIIPSLVGIVFLYGWKINAKRKVEK